MGRGTAGTLGLALAALLCLFATPAMATNYQRPMKEIFGPVEKPSFVSARAIGVDHSNGDVLVVDGGVKAVQRIAFSGFAAGDQFTLANLPAACSSSTTASIEYTNSPQSALAGQVEAKLVERCGSNIAVSGAASSGISITFEKALEGPQSLITCAAVAGHGSGTCLGENKTLGVMPGLYRFHADGTPAPFAALGSNLIDGRGSGACDYPPAPSPSCDNTPKGVLVSSGSLGQIAIDESGGPTRGNIYLSVFTINYRAVLIFSETGRYLGELTSGKGGTLRSVGGVAVDPSGVVYVSGAWLLGQTEITGVSKYVPSANPPKNADSTVTFPLPTAGLPEGFGYESAGGLALGSGPTAVSMFVAARIPHNNSGVSPINLVKMDPATGEGQLFAAGYGGGGPVTVDPTSGNPIANGANPQELVEFDGTAEFAERPISKLLASGDDRGIDGFATDSEGNVEVVKRSESAFTFGLPVPTPTVIVEEAKEITTATATLTGTVNPEGIAVSECFFEWGSTTAYGHSSPCAGGNPPTDSEGHEVSAAISGLAPNGTVYHYRLAAKNENGLEQSADETLRTAFTVRTGQAEVTSAHTAILEGTVRPEGHQYTECIFEYGLTTNPGYEHTAACSPAAAAIPPDFTPHTVEAEIKGLSEATAYRFRVKTANAAEGALTGEEETFETSGPPRIAAIRASAASQGAATLEAEINPQGFGTFYKFEWGPTASYGNVVPLGFESIGAGSTPVRVTIPITGLAAASTYHYRVIAASSAGTVESADHTLETLNSCGLPEGRCLEMVSPRVPFAPEQPGSFFADVDIHYQAADQGGAVAYVSEVGHEDATRGAEILYLGKRGEAGWESSQLSPPITAPDRQSGSSAEPSAFLGFASDLSCAVLAATQPLTSDPVGELMLEAGGGNLYRRNPDGTYTLITNRPPETLKTTALFVYSEFNLVGMNSDCSKVVFSTAHHYAGVAGAKAGGLYEWTEAGGLRYGGWVPKAGGGEEAVAASPGGFHAVSADASRVFFTATRLVGKVSGEAGKTGLFVREGGVSTDVSASETSTPDEGATYLGATRDGSHVYFTANNGLTSESSSAGTDLYEYDLEDEDLSDLSIGSEPGGAQVAGLVGVADDGSHAYFIARGQLVPGQGRTLAKNQSAKTFSLYDNAAGQVRFVATVAEGDLKQLTLAQQSETTSRVSVDGRYLLFEARGNVSGYPSGEAQQAYLYDAAAQAGEPTVSCVSCPQAGSPSQNTGTPTDFSLLDFGSFNRLYFSRTLALRGGEPLVFFKSRDALAPGATGTQNLYEWAHGQVYLVAADVPTNSFIGTSADTGDLYFFDKHALNWENPEARPEAWDARVGGGFPEPEAPPVPCEPATEGSCPAGPAAPTGTVPGVATSTYSGSGNVQPKKHKSKKKHKKSKKKHKKSKAKMRHGRANRNGRAGK